MSAPKILISVVVATSLSILACTNQTAGQSTSYSVQQNATGRTMQLSQFLNKNTVCPIREETNKEEGRVPRIIKEIKCAEQPSHCSKSVNQVDCCNHNNRKKYTNCTEITDTVLVFYETNGSNNTITVSVGCACMVHDKRPASTLPGSP